MTDYISKDGEQYKITKVAKKTLSKTYKHNISMWARNIPNCNIDEDNSIVGVFHEKIYEFIIKKYSNLNTIRVHLRVLITLLNNEGYGQFVEKYQEKYKNVQQKIRKDRENREIISDNDNWKSHEELLDIWNELEKMFIKNKTKTRNNYEYLVVSLYVLRPPLRLDYSNMEIILDNKCIQNNKNYLLKHNSSEYEIILQKDKVTRSQSTLKDKIRGELARIITQSLESIPRRYLITNLQNTDKPMTTNTLGKFISSIGKWNLNVSMLRSSYITWIYDQRDDLKTCRELARLMRNTPETARLEYRKYKNLPEIKLYHDY